MAQDPLRFSLLADNGIKEEAESDLNEPKICLFCPSKIFSTVDTVLQFKNYILTTCNYCTAISSKILEQINNTEIGTYFCSYCSTSNLNFKEFTVHIKQHSIIEKCICPEELRDGENIEFKEEEISSGSASDDLRIKNKPLKKKIYQCDHCYFKSAFPYNLSRHLKIHTGRKPYLCEQCGWKTSDKSNLSNHIRMHTGNKRHKCDYCEFSSMTTDGLKTHLRFHTGKAQSPKEKLFQCDQCGYSTSTTFNLKRHLRRHTGERPYICEFCDFKSIESAQLKRHIRIHTGEPDKEKSYKCHVCEYKTSANYCLKRHSAVHTREKPFICEHCGVKFKVNRSLIKHLEKIHSGENPFHCTYCKFKTHSSINLKTHLKIHMDYNYTLNS